MTAGPPPEPRPVLRGPGRRRELIRSLARSVVGVAVLVTAFYVAPIASTGPAIAIRVLVGVVVILALVAWRVQAIARADAPLLRAMEALAVTITFGVVVFASAYLSISARDGAAFSEPLGRTGALYFTITTLATVGFGDIAARTDAARIAVMIQILFNVAVIGAAVRLIATTTRRRLDSRDGR